MSERARAGINAVRVRLHVRLVASVAAVLLTVLPPLPAPSTAQTAPVPSAVLPTPPQVFIDTTWAPPSGPTIAVPAGGDFQGALNAAQPGSVITLQAGATYTGPFTLPNKAGAGWIYIESSALARAHFRRLIAMAPLLAELRRVKRTVSRRNACRRLSVACNS